MFNKGSATLILIFLFVCAVGTAAAQEVPSPPVTPPFEGAVLHNSQSGVAAFNDSSEFESNAVSTTRGYGDAYFWLSPVTDFISGEGATWLGTSAFGAHQICAQVRDFTFIGGNANPVCKSTSTAGDAVVDRKSQFASCGTMLAVRTAHSIVAIGFSWGFVEDVDVTNSC